MKNKVLIQGNALDSYVQSLKMNLREIHSIVRTQRTMKNFDIQKALASNQSLRKINPAVGPSNPDGAIHQPGSPVKSHSGAIKGHSRTALEDRFLLIWNVLGGPKLERELRFHPKRKWRFDFAHIGCKIAIEVQGGIHNNGAHARGVGITRDCIKKWHAAQDNWTVYELTTDMVTKEYIEPIIQQIRKWEDFLNDNGI